MLMMRPVLLEPGAGKAPSAAAVFCCMGVQICRRVHTEAQQPRGWTMTIKFTSKIIILACSVDMELDPLHIFLLLAGTIVSFFSRRHWRDIAGGKCFSSGYSVLSSGSVLLGSVNTFSSGWLLHCTVVSSCRQFLAPTSVDFSVEALQQNTSQ